jgi:hypothetical protein
MKKKQTARHSRHPKSYVLSGRIKRGKIPEPQFNEYHRHLRALKDEPR